MAKMNYKKQVKSDYQVRLGNAKMNEQVKQRESSSKPKQRRLTYVERQCKQFEQMEHELRVQFVNSSLASVIASAYARAFEETNPALAKQARHEQAMHDYKLQQKHQAMVRAFCAY